MAENQLVIPGLDEHDIALLPNTRNFFYYCDMIAQIRNNKCPFCDPMDSAKNPIVAYAGNWRMWKCPPEFRATSLREHFVIAPVKHELYIGKLSHEDFVSAWKLVRTALKEISGNLLSPHVDGEDVGKDGVYGLIIVPKGTVKVGVTFNEEPNPQLAKKILPLIYNHLWWRCMACKANNNLEHKLLLGPSNLKPIIHFDEMDENDFDALSGLISWCTNVEIGYGLPGGAFVMGWPGAALVVRFGDPKRHAGSIRHLHWNIMVPNEGENVKA